MGRHVHRYEGKGPHFCVVVVAPRSGPCGLHVAVVFVCGRCGVVFACGRCGVVVVASLWCHRRVVVRGNGCVSSWVVVGPWLLRGRVVASWLVVAMVSCGHSQSL